MSRAAASAVGWPGFDPIEPKAFSTHRGGVDLSAAVLWYRVKTFLLHALLAVYLCGMASAHNNLFFPGDAYFSAELTRDFFEREPPAGEDLALEYHRYAGKFMSCGYAGYENLVVKGLPPAMLANLRSTHALLNAFSPGVTRGADAKDLQDGHESGFPIFVYNRTFPLSSPFGIKYNEAWAEEQTAEAMMRHAIYDDLGEIDFVIDDWASAREIARLAIEEGRAPMVTELGETGIVRKPVEIEADKVQFVVLGAADVARFARREEGMVFFVVTEELRRYRFNREGVAMPQQVRFPPDDVAARLRVIQSDHQLLRSAINLYATNHGAPPSREQGLAALWEKPAVECPPDWMATLRKGVLDPWGRSYQWDGEVMFSLGADGVEGRDDVIEPFDLGGDPEGAPADGGRP